jgi:hypothetical protein
MDNLFKKVFSGFVSLTTILSSVGVGTFALPSAASAATLMAGDLIKASGPAVYYYGSDQKRYVFPNEKTYFSWFADFSSVKTISDAELAAIMIGGNVTIRPGTKLVKITTDPKVYAVTRCGTLHWVESEAIATALWGSAWASGVVDVPDGFFVNYTVGSSISSAVHPDGSLITYAANPGVRYVVWNGQKRKFTNDSAFAVNGYNAANVRVTTINYPDGTDVTGREANLADAVCYGASPVIGGGLTVSLASDTPAGMTVPRNAASVPLAKFNLMAGGGDVTITGLKLHRVGVGATTDLSNVYLYDGNGNRLTTGRTVNSVTNMVEYNSLNIMIPAGQTKAVMVWGDFNVASGSTGGQHSFEIMDAASAVISSNSTVSGSFPVRGNVFTVGTSAASRLDVQKGTQPTNPNIGAKGVEISNFKLIAGTNDIEVRRITLYQAGSVSNTDLSNFQLYQGTTLVASAASVTGNYIVLNFNPAYLLANGTTKVFSLKADVAGRAGRTIKTYVEYSTDVYAVDKVYNSGASICIASTVVDGCTATGQGSFQGTGGSGTAPQTNGNFIEVLTQGGQLTTTFNGPPQQNVAKGSQDVPLFKLSLASPDNTLEIRNLRFRLAGQSTDSVTAKLKGNAGTEYFRDLKLKNLDTGATVAGPITLPTTLANNATQADLVIPNSFNINAGQVMNLAITADIANAQDSGDDFFAGTSTYKVTLGDVGNSVIFNSTDVRVVSTGEFLDVAKIVPNAPIVGNAQTIKQSSLNISLASSPSSAQIVKKQQNVDSVGFVFSAGAQSDVTITAVKLSGVGNTAATYAANVLKDVIISCALFDGTTQVGLSQTPDTNGNMNITNMNVLVAKGTSKTLVAKCTADSVVAQATGDKYAVGIAAPTDVTAQDQDSNTLSGTAIALQVTGNANLNICTGSCSPSVAMTVRGGGTLTVSNGTMPQSTILVGGTNTWKNFAAFTAQAQFEDVTIDRIAVTSTGDAANFSGVAVAVNNQVVGSDFFQAGKSRNKDIVLTSPITVPKDGSMTFQLWGQVAQVQSSSTASGATAGFARTGNTMSLGLAQGITSGEYDSNYNDKFNIRAIGAASGDRLYATSTNLTGGVTGNRMVLRKSKPVVSQTALSNPVMAAGNNDLYKFTIATEGGDVAVRKIVFQFSKNTTTNSSLNLSNFRLRRGSNDMTLGDYRITSDSGTDLKSGSWPMASTTGYIVVEFTNTETISGGGSLYTLYATVGGTFLVGDSVTVSFVRNTANATPSIGYFTTFGSSTSTLNSITVPGPNLSTTAAPTNTSDVVSTFLWSDKSDNTSVQLSGTNGGSYDWSDDVLLEDLTKSQTVSR